MAFDCAPTSHRFTSQRLNLHYLDWGNPEAPPLILQHGGRDHAHSWDWVAQDLCKDWHVICPDLRGHGDAAWSPDGDYTMFAFVADFAQLVETLGYEQVTIGAHSLGGNIATRYAGLYPDRVRRLLNIEGLGLTPRDLNLRGSRPYADRLRRWIEDRRKAAGRLPRRYASFDDALDRMRAANATLSAAQVHHLTTHAITRNEDGSYSWKFDPYLYVWPLADFPDAEIMALWAAVTCPVLLVYGADSWATNPATDGRLTHFQDARVVEYANAGHWPHHDQLDRFLADLKGFL